MKPIRCASENICPAGSDKIKLADIARKQTGNAEKSRYFAEKRLTSCGAVLYYVPVRLPRKVRGRAGLNKKRIKNKILLDKVK